MTSLIQTKNLAFENFIFYKDIEIIAHSANFLTGASGAGKTTLLKLLNKTAKKSAGEIFFCGENINTLDPIALRQQMMLLGQEPYLFGGTILTLFNTLNQLFSGQFIEAFLQYFIYSALPPTSLSHVLFQVLVGTSIAGFKWFVAMGARGVPF